MKIAFTADQHARGKDLDAFSAQWSALWDICRSRGVEHVVSCGDLFDGQNIGDKNAETAAVVNAVVDPIVGYFGPQFDGYIGPEFHVISGNHDQNGPLRTSAVAALHGMQRIHVYTVPTCKSISPDVDLFVLPWVYGDMDNELDKMMWLRRKSVLMADMTTNSILVAHAQVVGAALNKLKACDHGIPRENPAWAAFDKVALGDFHKRQQLWTNGGYVGALRQLNHGEEGNPAGFEIYDTETRETEWIELNAAPRYCTTRIHSLDELRHFNPRPAHVNRVICSGFVPPRDLSTQLEMSGTTVETEVAKLERIDRGADVGEGALKNPRSLVAVYDSAQSEHLSDAEMAEVMALYDEVVR